MVRLSPVLKDENILKFQRDNAFLYLAKKMFVEHQHNYYSKLPIINEENKVAAMIT